MELTAVSSTVVEGLQGVATQATSVIGEVAPIGITIMGAFLVWNLGVRFFKSIARG